MSHSLGTCTQHLADAYQNLQTCNQYIDQVISCELDLDEVDIFKEKFNEFEKTLSEFEEEAQTVGKSAIEPLKDQLISQFKSITLKCANVRQRIAESYPICHTTQKLKGIFGEFILVKCTSGSLDKIENLQKRSTEILNSPLSPVQFNYLVQMREDLDRYQTAKVGELLRELTDWINVAQLSEGDQKESALREVNTCLHNRLPSTCTFGYQIQQTIIEQLEAKEEKLANSENKDSSNTFDNLLNLSTIIQSIPAFGVHYLPSPMIPALLSPKKQEVDQTADALAVFVPFALDETHSYRQILMNFKHEILQIISLTDGDMDEKLKLIDKALDQLPDQARARLNNTSYELALNARSLASYTVTDPTWLLQALDRENVTFY